MSRTQRNVFFIGILFIAIFLRFHHLKSTPPGLYFDEAMDGNNAVEAAQTNHFQVFYVEDNGREGLYVNIIAAFLKVHPRYEAWVIRLPAATAGVLTVWGLYLLVAELFGDDPGLLAAFLLATSFWHINFSRIGFRAILAPLLLVWALYFLLRAFKQNSPPWAWLCAILAGIAYGLGFYTYIAYRVTPLLLLLFIPFYRKYPQFWKRTVTFILISFLVAAPLGWYFATNPGTFFGRTSQISVTNASHPERDFIVNIAKEALMFNIRGDDTLRHNVRGAPELFWPVGILFLLGIVVAACFLVRQRRGADVNTDDERLFAPSGVLLAFAWLAFGILPAAASSSGIPHALRSILALPPAMIFAALGGIWLYRAIKRHWSMNAGNLLAAVFLSVVGIFGYFDYFIVWARDPNLPGAFMAGWVWMGKEINALPASTPKYVVVNTGAGYSARGIPIPAQTVMFITHSFTDADAAAANIHYILPDQISSIPANTPTKDVFYLVSPHR